MQSPVTAPKALWASSEAGGGPKEDHGQGSCRKAPSRGHLAQTAQRDPVLTLLGQ